MIALVAIVAFAFQTTRRAEPVSINVPTETELGAFITEQIAANPGAPITLKLAAGGSYTMTTDCPQLPVDAAFAITSDAANPATITWANKPIRGGKGLTIENVIIDASAASGHIVSMNKPNAETWGEGQASGDQTYWTLEPYKFENVKILGLVKCILLDANDNGRFIFPEIVFNKCTIELRTGDDSKNVPVNISYGAVEKFTLANSTVYSKTPTTTYSNFLQLGGTRIWKAPGYESTAEAYITFENNTFYEVSLGGKMLINSNAYKGQAQAKFIIKKNIFANTPDASKKIYKNITNASNAANQITAENNTYIIFGEGDPTYWNEVDLGSDEGIQDNPGFKDAANGDFTLALTSAQNVAKTGDPRWIQYSVTIADGIQNGTVVADVAAAKAGETVTLTATPAEGYELDAISVRGVTSDELVGVNDGKFTMPADAVTVSATFKPAPVDVEIAAADIIEGNITAAIATKAAGVPVKNLTITLAENTAYTVSAPIEAGGNVTITGAAGAKIDASALTTPFIKMSEISTNAPLNEKGAYVIDGITIKDVTITGLPYQLIYGNKQKYLMSKILVENSVIGINGTAKKTIFDFNGGGNASEIIVNNSTLWANPSNEQNGGLFSSQSGHGSIQDLGSDKQLFAITNSTIYNIAYGRTTNSQRRNNTAGMEYKVENSIIVNSGKNGQFIVGLNGGSANSAQTYTVNGNVFNFDDADVSAAEQAKVQEKIAEFAMTSINGVVAFTDAANGDFNGNCKLAIGAAAPEGKVGDPRWNVTYKESGVVLWSSEEPATIGWGEANITVAAEKFANAKVGDVMHVALQDIPAEAANPWDAQVELRGQNWKALEGAAFVAAPAKTAADFVLTGDILAIAKAQGIQINGTNCKTNLITLEYADKVAGSDASIWVGTATKENVILNKAHFANSNLFGGVKVGDKIRLTVKKTDPEGGEWIGLNYQTPSWVWSDFAEGSFATTITQTEEGAIIDFEVKTAEVAQILNADNAQIIVNNPNQTVTQVELIVAPVDITISPESGADIFAALKAETDKVAKVGKITIILADNGTYTVSAPIVAPSDLYISLPIGSEGVATIDASGNEGDFITLNGSTTFAKKADGTDSDHYLIDMVGIAGVKITGLKGALITDAQKTLVNGVAIANSVIEMPAAGKNVLNFNGKGYVGKVKVLNSTIYAKDKNTGFFAQYGSRPKNIDGNWLQEFDVQNSTIVNIANGKNFCDLKQNGTAQNVYTLKNNIFVDCGKNGQVVVGFNKGQASATPVWDVDGNIFNAGGEDKSAAEVEKAGQKDGADIVKNSVAGVVTFTNAAEGDFNGTFAPAEGTAAPATMPGDPRWTIAASADKLYVISDLNGWDRTALTELTFNAETQAYEWEIAPTGFFNFAFATKQLTAAEAEADPNWEDFNNNYRYAIAAGDNLATLNEALPLLKVNGTIQLKAVKEGTTYKISVAKDLSTVTITGEAAPEQQPGTVDKLFIMGNGTPGEWGGTTELTFNEATQAFEYVATITGDTYLTFGDAEFTTWDEFNGKHRFAPAEGNTDVVLDQATQLVLVNDGCVVLKTPGTYKISVTKNLVMTVTADGTGINGIAADKMKNAIIYTVSGQRVEKAQKGLYIIDGKKVVVK